MTCSACGKPKWARGLCKNCYSKARRAGKFGTAPCRFPDCLGVLQARGLCSKHYQWIRKNGLPLPDRKNRDSGTGEITNEGYVRIWKGKERYHEHRAVMETMLNRKLVAGECVHHKNGIRHDNKSENLELWHKGQPGGQRIEDLVKYLRGIGFKVTPPPGFAFDLSKK